MTQALYAHMNNKTTKKKVYGSSQGIPPIGLSFFPGDLSI
jgi:hypothetical protein